MKEPVKEPVRAAQPIPAPQPAQQQAKEKETLIDDMPKAHVIGSCFDTYILAEDESGLILIDKHAAHERILFNQLRKQVDIPTQMLLQPVVVDLSGEEYAAMMDGMEQIQSIGFVMEPFGQHSVAVREAPAYIDAGDLPMTRIGDGAEADGSPHTGAGSLGRSHSYGFVQSGNQGRLENQHGRAAIAV